MSKRLDEIEKILKGVGPTGAPYKRDMEYLINRVRKLEEIVRECARHQMLAHYIDTSNDNQSKIYWTDLTIKARKALGDDE